MLLPRPTPNNPPEPIAYKLWIIWYPVPVASDHGFKNTKILSILNESDSEVKFLAKYPPTPAIPSNPTSTKCSILEPAISIITQVIAPITKHTLKWFWKTYNIPIGIKTNVSGNKNPFAKSFKSSLWSVKYPA